MSENESEEELSGDGMQRDSRLESFLRRASAIIASEKGLNSVARAKLDELAQSLHLPDELFQKGLEQLQKSNSPVGNLTDYEKAFLKFLAREFSQKRSGSVLSISIEEKAVAHAEGRFGIDAHRAEKLIDYQAKEDGIGRLSRLAARDYGQQMILDVVGDRLELDDAANKKIDHITKRWGCEADEVRDLVRARIRENKTSMSRARRKPFMLVAFAATSLIAIAMCGKLVHDNFDTLFSANVIDLPPPPEPEPQPNLVEAKSELELAFADLASSIASEDNVVRAGAMVTATERVLARSDKSDSQKRALSSWFLKEPDALVANRFNQTIEKAINSAPRTNRDAALERPYRAARLAHGLCNTKSPSASSPRIESLSSLLKKKVGTDLLPDLPAIDAAIATDQWNQLIENSYRDPVRCSILVEPLQTLTESKLPTRDRQQFVSRSVRTIILADRSQWQNMKQPILSAIRSADEVQRMEWIDIWLDEFDGSIGFRRFAAGDLLPDAANQKQLTAREMENRMRAALSAWRNRKFEIALLRHGKIQKRFEQLKPIFESSNARVSPDLVYQAALTANLCLEAMSIMDSGQASKEAVWTDVDAQLERFDDRLREFVFLDDQTTTEPEISSAGFDTTTRDRTIAAFSDLSQDNQPRRIAAIERLPKLTEKFRSIPSRMARSIASYVIAPHDADEWLQLQRVLPSLMAWPKVVLSISDQLTQSKASDDQLRTMYTVLAGDPWESADGLLSKQAMSVALLELTHELLLAKEKVDPNLSDSDWLRLEKYLQTAYWQRASLLAGDRSLPNRSVLENVRQAVLAGADRIGPTKRAIELIENGTQNDLERVVLFNQLMIRKREGTSDANTELDLGTRLLQTELKLLQMWNDQREQQLRGLVDGF